MGSRAPRTTATTTTRRPTASWPPTTSRSSTSMILSASTVATSTRTSASANASTSPTTSRNAPSYIISKDEVVAIRQCCAKEFAINPKFILPAHSCADDADIIKSLRKTETSKVITNTKIVQWLHENNCGRFDKTAKSFKGKQEGADADTVQGYKVKGIQKTYPHLVHCVDTTA